MTDSFFELLPFEARCSAALDILSRMHSEIERWLEEEFEYAQRETAAIERKKEGKSVEAQKLLDEMLQGRIQLSADATREHVRQLWSFARETAQRTYGADALGFAEDELQASIKKRAN